MARGVLPNVLLERELVLGEVRRLHLSKACLIPVRSKEPAIVTVRKILLRKTGPTDRTIRRRSFVPAPSIVLCSILASRPVQAKPKVSTSS